MTEDWVVFNPLLVCKELRGGLETVSSTLSLDGSRVQKQKVRDTNRCPWTSTSGRGSGPGMGSIYFPKSEVRARGRSEDTVK